MIYNKRERRQGMEETIIVEIRHQRERHQRETYSGKRNQDKISKRHGLREGSIVNGYIGLSLG